MASPPGLETLYSLLGLSKKTLPTIGRGIRRGANLGGKVIKRGIIPAGVAAGYYGTKALNSLVNSLVQNSGDPVSQAALRAAKGIGGFAKQGYDAYSGLKSRLFSETSSDKSTQINNITTSKVSDDSAIVSLLQQILVKVSPVPNINSSVNKLLALQLLQYRTEKLERLQDLENMRERSSARGIAGAGGGGGILPAAGKVGLAGLAGLAGAALADYLTGGSGSDSGGGAGSGAGAGGALGGALNPDRLEEVRNKVNTVAGVSNFTVAAAQGATMVPVADRAKKLARRAALRERSKLRRAQILAREARDLRALSAIRKLTAKNIRQKAEERLYKRLVKELAEAGAKGDTAGTGAAKIIDEFFSKTPQIKEIEARADLIEKIAERQAMRAKQALDASETAKRAANRLTKTEKILSFIGDNAKTFLAKLAAGLSVLDFGVDTIFGGLSAKEWESSVTASSLGGLLAGGEGGVGNSIFNVLKWLPVAAGGAGLAVLAGAPAAVATAVGGTIIGAAGLLGLIGGDDVTKFLDSNFPGLKKLDPYTAPIVASAGRVIESIYDSVASAWNSIFSSGDEFTYDADKWAPLMKALIMTESEGDPYAVGKAGEKGWTQIMPYHWERLGESLGVKFDPFNEMHSLLGGTIILEEGIQQVGLDMRKLLLAYNAGPDAVKRAEKIAKEAGLDTDWESIKSFVPARQLEYVESTMNRYEKYSKYGSQFGNIGNRNSLNKIAESLAPAEKIYSEQLNPNKDGGINVNIGHLGNVVAPTASPTPTPTPVPLPNDPIGTSSRRLGNNALGLQ